MSLLVLADPTYALALAFEIGDFRQRIYGSFHVSGKVVNSLSGMGRGRCSSAVGQSCPQSEPIPVKTT